jgi:carboxymethylenebutenolidase
MDARSRSCKHRCQRCRMNWKLIALAIAAVTTSCSPPPPPVPSSESVAATAPSSPRHGEWIMVRTTAGDSVRAWLVYPERPSRAPVVVVVHEVYGLTPWIRGVADQLAAAGFVAVAPDLLTGRNIPGAPLNPNPQAAQVAVRALRPDDVHRQLRAVADHVMRLPAALPRYGIVGFCWGGGVAFEHAVRSPSLAAAVVYYGVSPAPASLASVRAPVLGLYGSDDARVNNTVPAADSAMRALGKTYRVITYEGAGHGFLRQIDERQGANRNAAERAWPEMITWFRRYLGA